MGAVTDKEAYVARPCDIISQRQCFVDRSLISYVGNVFGLHGICVCFPSTRKLVTGRTQRFAPTTVPREFTR
jgi:hypothetical protein